MPEGLAYTLEFTEERREATAGDTPVRVSTSLRGRHLVSPEMLPDADIVVVGTRADRIGRLPSARSFVMPIRVHFVLDVDQGYRSVLANASKGAKRDFRQQYRKHAWEFGAERDPSWFDFFYDRIYRATMIQRYGDHARTESRDSAYECLFRSGALFHLSMDGERVGGHLCHWDPGSGVLTSRLLGVLDGAEEYYEAGVLKVMYFLLMEWAAENGVRRLDFQGTEAFLSKGTYQMKRRFGTRVILPPNHFGRKRLWLQVRRDTPAVRDFLVANPLLRVTDEGTLHAVYFHDGERPPREDYRAMGPGVEAVHHISLDEFLAGCRHDGRAYVA
ncbi:GNAT family N-acetyltransferase [Streptomyces olindensis]|uniref:GNAT family N-acetyltransferase n=1 Tax=Streptomyces olindensis TaxID=358823 RepID=UPI0036AF9B40